MITEAEAKQTALAVMTAMAQNDKESREAVYKDMTPDELQRVLRWTTRWLLFHMAVILKHQGVDFNEGLAAFAMSVNYDIEQKNGE